MSISVWMRRIALTVATTALAGTQLLSPAMAGPADPPPPGQDGLLAHVPSQIQPSCSSGTDKAAAEGWLPAGASDVQLCQVDSPSGATVVVYLAFGDDASLLDAFTAEAPAAPGSGTCDDGSPGQMTYSQGGSPDIAGEMACFTHADGTREIAWTHEQSRILGVLVDPQLDLAQLAKIWTDLGPVTEAGSDQQALPV
jgi:hypothetical protein